MRRRFSVAECFGVIWVETLEEVALTDQEQAALYEELIYWAKHRLFPNVIHSYSPSLFTGQGSISQGFAEGSDQGCSADISA